MGQAQTAGAISDVATPMSGDAPIGTGVPGLVTTEEGDGAHGADRVVVLGVAGPGASPGRFRPVFHQLPDELTVEERQRRREAVIHDLEQARRRRRRPASPAR